MKHLFKMRYDQYELSECHSVPQMCKRIVIIPTIDKALNHYYYWIDLESGVIKRWFFDVQALIEYMEKLMAPYMEKAVYQFSSKESFLSALTEPHSVCYSDGQIYITPLMGNFILHIDVHSDDYYVYTDNPLHIYCSTKNIVNNALYFSRWLFTDSVKRDSPEQCVSLQLGRFLLKEKRFEILKTLNAPDNIHDTIATPDEEKMIVLEMPRFPLYQNNVEMVMKTGIKGKVFVYDIKNDVCQTDIVENAPGHIVLDNTDSSIMYLSCHNLLHSACFGAGKFLKYNIGNILSRIGEYAHEGLFRIPSHSSYQYKGENLICTSAFPSQLYLIDANTMKLKKKIQIGQTNWKADFSRGPFNYPRHDRTPYGAFPVNGTPYILLANLWTVSIINIESEETIYRSPINMLNDPIFFTGHSICVTQ